jgi:hypothetical protein
MNSFLDLHTDENYRNVNRPYYTGTWEYTNVASDYMIPFQWLGGDVGDFDIYVVDIEGNETDRTLWFTDGVNLITDWTLTGTGSWTLDDPGPSFFAADPTAVLDIIRSNTFSAIKNQTISLHFDLADNVGSPANWTVSVLKDGVGVAVQTGIDGWDGDLHYLVTETASNYSVAVGVGAIDTCTLSFGTATISYISQAGNYFWYSGFNLSFDQTDIYRLKIVHDGNTFYSDWMDPCGFEGKLKYKISSSFDFGGIKYDEGYEQWIYKNASVRRSPRAEIEQIGDQRNGVLILEKSIASVRYVMKMKCTESEYEAFVHSIGGTVEITDQTGKVYDATNIEISDPTWYRSNGIVEISFTDQNNVNVWTKNNESL